MEVGYSFVARKLSIAFLSVGLSNYLSVCVCFFVSSLYF